MSCAAAVTSVKEQFIVPGLLGGGMLPPYGYYIDDNKDNISIASDDSISVSSDDDMDERPTKVTALGKALQKTILKGCIKGEETTSTNTWKSKVKQMMIKFVRMFLYDYSKNDYSYIRAILIDCKGLIEDHDLDDEKEFLLKGLKLIKEKCINEDIPFCGAGGFEL